MDWTSFLIGLFLGELVGMALLACLQLIKERRYDGDDFVEEIEALRRLSEDDPDAQYIQGLRADNRSMVERIIGKEDA